MKMIFVMAFDPIFWVNKDVVGRLHFKTVIRSLAVINSSWIRNDPIVYIFQQVFFRSVFYWSKETVRLLSPSTPVGIYYTPFVIFPFSKLDFFDLYYPGVSNDRLFIFLNVIWTNSTDKICPVGQSIFVPIWNSHDFFGTIILT